MVVQKKWFRKEGSEKKVQKRRFRKEGSEKKGSEKSSEIKA